MNYDLILRSHRTLTPDGERPADVGIRDGVIAAVAGFQALSGDDVIDLGSARCCPAWSTPTCTSTSRGAPSGRASTAPPGPPPRAVSPPSSTCR
ncbi:hypothetical protein ACFQZ4_11305 [Catellatospora coxensis]